MNKSGRVEPTPPECALAAEMFDHFCSAGTMKQILALHREICNTLNLKPNRLPDFYPKLKAKLAKSWKAQALFKKFDLRANHKVYGKGKSCAQTKVLIIGAGPCGLRAAIECQLLGAKVVVIEKRDRISRNNVLHLWPFVIQDLRALGAKKFFGKFCAGSIDHISIRQLQCILMKVALLLGVELHEGVSFEELLEPTITDNSERLGWRARVSPDEHPVKQYEFDVLVGADGKRNTLHGFKRKEFRGKLAMAITANFINRHTEQEASVPEISGVAFIFNQKFFKELYEVTRIDLENIVYYKDDTHYFVMTAKKHSLLDKGVLLNDYAEVSRLLSVENVDRAALMRYAQEAARFSTDGRLPLPDFALNHYGEPDVALFDFTSMYAAENASMVYERQGRKLLCQLVGDSLLEPFWPTGSGCARGFLSALDAAWAVRAWGQSPSPHPLEVIAERESIYRLLAQTTPENLHRDLGAYTLDPGTRYPNLNRTAVTPHRVTPFYDSDDPLPLDATSVVRKRRRDADIPEEALISWVGCSEPGIRAATSASALTDLLRRYRPDLIPPNSSPLAVYHVLQHEFGITPFTTSGQTRDVPAAKLQSYLARVYNAFKGEVPHIHHQSDVFDQIKRNQQKEKHVRNTAEQSVSVYSNVAEIDKSTSSYRKKRRSLRTLQVSNDASEHIRKKIGKLDLKDFTQICRIIEGRDAIVKEDTYTDKQKDIHDGRVKLIDRKDSPDPKIFRDELEKKLQKNMKLKPKESNESNLAPSFFENKKVESTERPSKPSRQLEGLDIASLEAPESSETFHKNSADAKATVVKINKRKKNRIQRRIKIKTKDKFSYLLRFFENKKVISTRRPSKPSRKLKGLDIASLEAPDSSDTDNSADSKATVINKPKKEQFISSTSIDTPQAEVIDPIRKRYSQSPEVTSIKRSRTSASLENLVNRESHSMRSGSIENSDTALRCQKIVDVFEGKRCSTPSPERTKRTESIGNSEMKLRIQRMADLFQGNKPRQSPELTKKRNSSDMALRVQRFSDMMQKRNAEPKRPKIGGKRKAARAIMKQRFEKSLQMLATERRLEFATSVDLQNDYGLQQYRANAPHFDERVKKLEKQLQHNEEGRIVGGGIKAVGGGALVARLAAELSNTTPTTAPPKASKPKDLMRSVGKIERDDWNVKEIERKILENRLGRPEPKGAEKVPKWDREQFLGRQRRLKEGEQAEEKWGEIDDTLHKLDQKLKDSGRPDHGTKKVANLATKFVKREEPDTDKVIPKEESKKSWRGPSSTGVQCASCGTRVFAAEGVTADGLHLHRACFRCAVCKTVLRPGNYTMERYGSRLVCMRHSGVSVPDTVTATSVLTPSSQPQAITSTPERISLELSDSGAREIDEDEWTDRNCLASETSGAGGLSEEEESSEEWTDVESDDEAQISPKPVRESAPRSAHRTKSDLLMLYFSDDSFGYDDFSDDGAESSGNESCSRMRAAREARRREVPVDARPPTDSSEVESEDEIESSDEEVSSATEVSTDSEFAREECVPAPSPPAIMVTEAPPPAPPPTQDYPLSRTRSAGGLATKRALELKRRYLLGEPSPPAVRKSDSTSQLDTKLEAFRTNITEFQKLLHPAPALPSQTQPQKPVVALQVSEESKIKPMPDIIKNLFEDAPVDLLIKVDSPLCKNEWRELIKEEKKVSDLETDSLSDDDSSHTETAPNQSVPRVEVHDEGGELIQLDSLMLINSSTEENEERATGTATATVPTIIAVESESSESCRDATTLALTETELSDWAAESAVLDDCGLEEKEEKKRNKNPRTLSGPKSVHDAKNISAITSHVCGRTSPLEPIVYSNALEHFEFVDEGDQDPTIGTPVTPRNEGYVEFVDDNLGPYCPSNDRSKNFIERSFSETLVTPTGLDVSRDVMTNDFSEVIEFIDKDDSQECESSEPKVESNIKSPLELSDKSSCENAIQNKVMNTEIEAEGSRSNKDLADMKMKFESISLSEISPPLEENDSNAEKTKHQNTVLKDNIVVEDAPSPLAQDTLRFRDIFNSPISLVSPASIRMYSPAICRSASETFKTSNSRCTDSPSRSVELPASINLSSSISPTPLRDMTDKVQEIKREREEQTEVVRRLVLERLGNEPRLGRKSTRKTRVSPAASVPPPVPPPPVLPIPSLPPTPPPPTYSSPPPRPQPPLITLPVAPSFSDPELARERRTKGIMKSISNYLNRHLGPRHKQENQTAVRCNVHKSTGALQEAPPVPPPPASYSPPAVAHSSYRRIQTEQQAAAVAELVQVSAQRDAHQALMAADRRRSAAGGVVGD